MFSVLTAFVIKNWRIFAIAAALVVIGWWHQHEMTKAYRQGATDRERSALQEAAVKVEADTAARMKELDDRAASLDAQEARTTGERAALNAARAGISAALTTSLNQIATQNLDIKNEIHDLPDDSVNARFRLSLQRAGVAERERAADR